MDDPENIEMLNDLKVFHSKENKTFYSVCFLLVSCGNSCSEKSWFD